MKASSNDGQYFRIGLQKTGYSTKECGLSSFGVSFFSEEIFQTISVLANGLQYWFWNHYFVKGHIHQKMLN